MLKQANLYWLGVKLGTVVAALRRDEVDVQCGDESLRSARVLQCGAVGGEAAEGGDAAVALVGAGVSPGVEVGEDDC